MDLNRPQLYMAGIIILMLGLQLRLVDSIVLNDNASQFLAEKVDGIETANTSVSFLNMTMPIAKRVITPPKWLGWSLVSVGGVMVLHSLAMRKQG